MSGIIIMNRKMRPKTLLTMVITPLVVPSPVGYDSSHASSKIRGTAAFRQVVAPMMVE